MQERVKRTKAVLFRKACLQNWLLAGIWKLDFWNLPYDVKTF